MLILFHWSGETLAAALPGNSAVANPWPLAMAAPAGLGEWLTALVFLLIVIEKLTSVFKGQKIQQPLNVQSAPKYATADAFSRHCTDQKSDLEKLREALAGMRSELLRAGEKREAEIRDDISGIRHQLTEFAETIGKLSGRIESLRTK